MDRIKADLTIASIYVQFQSKRSVRLGHSHSIIYMLLEDEVVVLTIAPRRDAYR